MLKRKNAFASVYPLLEKYIIDENTRKNMLNNADLRRKYVANDESIKAFLHELDKYFTIEEARKIIIETILKYPDEILLAFISAYLNSSEDTKANAEVVTYYNKILSYGTDCITHVSTHGIVCTRKYKELPQMVINDKLKKLAGDNAFKGEKIKDLIPNLTDREKNLALNLLENNSFFLLNILFGDLNCPLKYLLDILILNDIDANFINEDFFKLIGGKYLRILIFLLIDTEKAKIVKPIIDQLVSSERIPLLQQLIDKKLIDRLDRVDIESLESASDEQVISQLEQMNITILKKDE